MTDDFDAAEILILDVMAQSVTFEWGRTRLTSATGYVLSIGLPGSSTRLQNTVVSIQSNLQHTFGGLVPGTVYVLYVEVLNVGGLESRSRSFRTSEYTSPST